MSAVSIEQIFATETAMIEHAEAYRSPDHLPTDNHGCYVVLINLARRWAWHVAQGILSLDDAYLQCRIVAESAQVSSSGAVRWKDAMRLMMWQIDYDSEMLGRVVASFDHQSRAAMRDAAMAALNAAGGDAELRDAIAEAAEAQRVAPPLDMLHQVYHQSIAEARGNARWIASRGHQPSAAKPAQ